MFASALIVFREVFEIVLIVGIVLAATRDMPHRTKAIAIGFATGLLGAGIVAAFTGYISNLAEGVGQEMFNSMILFTAAAFIGWTLLWMKQHSREMKTRFTQIGEAVADGTLPYISLSIIIMLAILREGSEIVLFSYGMLATGASLQNLLMGAGIGMAGGTLIGVFLYKGMIRLPVKLFFQVTSTLLMLLVAGMMSQAFGYLVAAGSFEQLSNVVWDSSWLLQEGSLIGQSLKVLIGYTAQPTAIQLIAYLSTLGGLYLMLRITEGRKFKTRTAATAMIAGILVILFAPDAAHASKKVYAPYVEKGEVELEWRGGYKIDDESDVNGSWKQKLALGYGVTDYWFTEVYGEVEHDGASDGNTELTAIEWENKFQLTQPGEYFVDLGALVEYVHFLEDDGADKLEGKLLIAKDTGNFTHLANLVVEREVGDNSEDETEYGAAWSTRYRYSPKFEPGIEIYSDFGDFDNDFDEQGHQIGPVAYGQLTEHVAYDAGVLFGVSDAAPDAELKAIIEYEWRF
jgi:high-affinity iron transporter